VFVTSFSFTRASNWWFSSAAGVGTTWALEHKIKLQYYSWKTICSQQVYETVHLGVALEGAFHSMLCRVPGDSLSQRTQYTGSFKVIPPNFRRLLRRQFGAENVNNSLHNLHEWVLENPHATKHSSPKI
jgi:hypothetical protein